MTSSEATNNRQYVTFTPITSLTTMVYFCYRPVGVLVKSNCGDSFNSHIELPYTYHSMDTGVSYLLDSNSFDDMLSEVSTLVIDHNRMDKDK